MIWFCSTLSLKHDISILPLLVIKSANLVKRLTPVKRATLEKQVYSFPFEEDTGVSVNKKTGFKTGVVSPNPGKPTLC